MGTGNKKPAEAGLVAMLAVSPPRRHTCGCYAAPPDRLMIVETSRTTAFGFAP
jgi:hypothetical protein